MPRLKVAIVGQGSIGQKHTQSARAVSSEIEVAVVSRRSPEAIDQGLIYFGAIEHLLDWQPDVVLLANEASKRRDDFRSIADSPATILLEKPVAGSLEDALAIKAIDEARDARTFVAYNLRMSGALSVVRQIVDAGGLGTLCHVTSVVGHNLELWRPGRNVANTASASRAQGGGVIRELSHEIDVLNNLLGPLSCHYAAYDTKKFTDFDVEDVAHMGFRAISNVGTVPVSLVMDFVRHDVKREIDVIGTDASIRWNMVDGTVTRYEADGAMSVIYNDPTDLATTRQNLWNHILTGDCSRLCTLDDGIAVMRLIQQVEEQGAS